MNSEIICVGTEILLGNIVNTNSAYLSEKLSKIGINLYYHTVVGDNEKRLSDAILLAADRSDLIILTGGLGPTYDDITKETAAKVFGKKLILDDKSLESIKEYFIGIGREMTENNIKQAYTVEGGTILENAVGTAPGVYFTAEHCGKNVHIAVLPGPPSEMSVMYENELLPILLKLTNCTLHSHTLRIFGVGESKIENDLRELMEKSVNPTLAPYAKNSEVELRFTAKAKTPKQADELIMPMLEKVKAMYKNAAYGTDVSCIEEALVRKLKEKNLKIAFAESCTGGLIAKKVTDISGASAVIGFSAVTYSNEAKSDILGVDRSLLEKYGAISRECAIAMAQGVQKLSGADIAVSTTGIAGPDACEGKPVGLVYIGVCTKGAVPYCIELKLARGKTPQRSGIRDRASSYALYEAYKNI